MAIPEVLVMHPCTEQTLSWVGALESDGFHVVSAPTGGAAAALLETGAFDAVVIDDDAPDAAEALAAARQQTRRPAVVAFAADATVEGVVACMRQGADDFLPTRAGTAAIVAAVRRALGRLESSPALSALVGGSPEMTELRELIRRIGESDATVLIHGESGTGKELVARALHECSARRHGRFVAVNCAAIPDALLESELFGHAKGSFTGATCNRVGRFELAAGGTLFLDEVGDMPLALQVKLLRVLQERVVEPIGSARQIKVDVRIIAASHRDLEALAREGKLREDLFYRLNVVPIGVPPLRERQGDIPALCAAFLARASRSRRGPQQMRQDALEMLAQYRWPGNVRELENLVARLAVLVHGTEIGAADLPPRYRGQESLLDEREALLGAHLPDGGMDLRSFLAAVEQSLITQAIQRSGGNKGVAAALLSLNRTTLSEKMKRMELAA